MRFRDHLGISAKRQAQVTHAMQLVLAGLLFIGLDRGSAGIVINAAIALAVTYIPAVLERDYHIPMDAGLTLWITSAVFLHALGTTGVPGGGGNLYRNVWWWDHLTHTLSSSIVAAAGYATARAFDQHSDAVRLPPRFMFVFILTFVVAFGVFWEVIEFALGSLGFLAAIGPVLPASAEATVLGDLLARFGEMGSSAGGATILTQYGLDDTMLDLLFDALGGVIVAVWGTAYLTDVAGAISSKFGRSRA